ncbi:MULTISPECIES: hypothetical protein [unclassified Streptomyces]
MPVVAGACPVADRPDEQAVCGYWESAWTDIHAAIVDLLAEHPPAADRR